MTFKETFEEHSIEECMLNNWTSGFIDQSRPYVAIVCNESGFYYCKALDKQPKSFSCVLDRGYYEFDSEDKVVEFLRNNINK